MRPQRGRRRLRPPHPSLHRCRPRVRRSAPNHASPVRRPRRPTAFWSRPNRSRAPIRRPRRIRRLAERPARVFPLPSAAPAQPYASFMRGAEHQDGVIDLVRKDDQLYLDLRPENFDQPYIILPSITSGVGGEAFAGRVYDPLVVIFKRVGKRVMWVTPNTHYVADKGTVGGRVAGGQRRRFGHPSVARDRRGPATKRTSSSSRRSSCRTSRGSAPISARASRAAVAARPAVIIRAADVQRRRDEIVLPEHQELSAQRRDLGQPDLQRSGERVADRARRARHSDRRALQHRRAAGPRSELRAALCRRPRRLLRHGAQTFRQRRVGVADRNASSTAGTSTPARSSLRSPTKFRRVPRNGAARDPGLECGRSRKSATRTRSWSTIRRPTRSSTPKTPATTASAGSRRIRPSFVAFSPHVSDPDTGQIIRATW